MLCVFIYCYITLMCWWLLALPISCWWWTQSRGFALPEPGLRHKQTAALQLAFRYHLIDILIFWREAAWVIIMSTLEGSHCIVYKSLEMDHQEMLIGAPLPRVPVYQRRRCNIYVCRLSISSLLFLIYISIYIYLIIPYVVIKLLL